jgi:hypothetical protein
MPPARPVPSGTPAFVLASLMFSLALAVAPVAAQSSAVGASQEPGDADVVVAAAGSLRLPASVFSELPGAPDGDAATGSLSASPAASGAPLLAAPRPSRPTVLVPLYLGFVGLQAADTATTFRALNVGAVEANPVMGSVVQNRGAFVAVKAGMTTATLLVSERLWKNHRTAAVIMMAALNGAYAGIVAHNARVVSSLTR